MTIAICDDDKEVLSELKNYISDYFINKNLLIRMDCFNCAEDFLHSGQTYDILFMDIYLDGMNGMDAVRTLPRSGGPAVVFTTTSREHAIEAFSLKAVHYLLKPLTRDGVKEALDRCLVSCSKNEEKFLMVKNNQGTIPVPTGNIIYIEVFNKISTIHTIRNDIQTYTSLDALFEYLDTNCFMKAQRSYIVNMKFIQTFYFDRLTLHNGIEIILSRKHRSVLKKQYQDYLFRLAREGEV